MTILDVDPRSLVVLHLVAQTGSMSAAARELQWTHPAVSQHIRRLERMTGRQLLERHGRGIRLTTEGVALARLADDLVASLRAASRGVSDLRGQGPRLRVATFPTASATLLVSAIGELASTHPDVQVEVFQAEPPQARAALDSGEVDVALVFDDQPPTGSHARLLATDTTVVAMPEGHPLNDEPGVAVGALADTVVIAGCPTCQTRLLRHCDTHGVHVRLHHMVTDDYVVMQAMVAARQGLAVLPGLAVQAHHRVGLHFRPLEPPLQRYVTAHLPTRRSTSDATQHLLKALQRAANQENANRPAATAPAKPEQAAR